MRLMTQAITSLEQITPAWLTTVLHRAGALPRGEVQAVVFGRNPAFNSTVTHLALSYTGDAPATAPRRLVLKRNLDEPWAKRAGAREAAFYSLVATLPDPLPMLVPCYDAAHDPTTGNGHLLLLDVGATHHIALPRDDHLSTETNMPAPRDMEAVVDALAALHARWWQHPLLGTDIPVGPWWQDQPHYEHEIRRREAAFAALCVAERSWFPQPVQRLYERALAGLPVLWRRFLQPRLPALHNLTLTHNDSYFANFLCPDDPGGATYIVDWQEPAAGRGADDMANLLATFWTREQRAQDQRETRLLRRYYGGLCAHGVQGYGWDDFMTDYRIGIVEWLFVPVQDRADGSPASYWWPKMQCLVAAYEDHDCAALLRG
jgi:hypothetical protein